MGVLRDHRRISRQLVKTQEDLEKARRALRRNLFESSRSTSITSLASSEQVEGDQEHQRVLQPVQGDQERSTSVTSLALSEQVEGDQEHQRVLQPVEGDQEPLDSSPEMINPVESCQQTPQRSIHTVPTIVRCPQVPQPRADQRPSRALLPIPSSLFPPSPKQPSPVSTTSSQEATDRFAASLHRPQQQQPLQPLPVLAHDPQLRADQRPSRALLPIPSSLFPPLCPKQTSPVSTTSSQEANDRFAASLHPPQQALAVLADEASHALLPQLPPPNQTPPPALPSRAIWPNPPPPPTRPLSLVVHGNRVDGGAKSKSTPRMVFNESTSDSSLQSVSNLQVFSSSSSVEEDSVVVEYSTVFRRARAAARARSSRRSHSLCLQCLQEDRPRSFVQRLRRAFEEGRLQQQQGQRSFVQRLRRAIEEGQQPLLGRLQQQQQGQGQQQQQGQRYTREETT